MATLSLATDDNFPLMAFQEGVRVGTDGPVRINIDIEKVALPALPCEFLLPELGLPPVTSQSSLALPVPQLFFD